MSSTAPSTHGARRWWALAAITLGVMAAGLDITILSVALPTLAGALHASESDLQWFSSAYAVVLSAGMLPAGVLGDRYGRRKVLAGSLLLFALGSLGCALSTNPGQFIVARTALGLAASGLTVMAISSLTVLFSEAERPRAVGIWGAANFLALPVGPILGGWMLERYWWGWVFLINIPVSLLGLLAVVALVPETRASEAPAVDPMGIATSSLGLVAVTYGVIELGRNGFGDVASWAVLVAGLAVLVGFVLWERRLARTRGRALVDLTVFASRSFTGGILLAALGVLAMVGVLFTMPQYFQGVAGTDAQVSGIRLIPLIVGIVLGAVPADRVAALVGPRITAAIGFVILSAGMLAGATTRVDSSAWFVAGWMASSGLGMGMALATSASAALGELSSENSGVGSALMQAVQKVGAPFGSAILGSVVVAAYQAHLDLTGVPGPAAGAVRASVFGGVAVASRLRSPGLMQSVLQAFVYGMDVALVVSAGIAALGIALALVLLPRRPAAATARQEARQVA